MSYQESGWLCIVLFLFSVNKLKVLKLSVMACKAICGRVAVRNWRAFSNFILPHLPVV